MRYACKATTRIVSMILVVALMLTAFPTSAFASIDEPLNGATGSGWDDFGGMPGEDESVYPPVVPPQPDDDIVDNDYPDDEGTANDNNNPPVEDESETAVATPTATSAPVATPGTLGASGVVIDLPSDVLEDFIAFMDHATEAIESPVIGITPFAGVGDTGTISWSWGEAANFNAGGYYVNQIPSLTLSTTRPSEGRPFCAQFGPDPLTGGIYTASAFTHPTILKLMIAFNEGKATAVGVQLAIWSITNASAFATHPEAQAALSAANSVSTDPLFIFVTGHKFADELILLRRELSTVRVEKQVG